MQTFYWKRKYTLCLQTLISSHNPQPNYSQRILSQWFSLSLKFFFLSFRNLPRLEYAHSLAWIFLFSFYQRHLFIGEIYQWFFFWFDFSNHKKCITIVSLVCGWPPFFLIPWVAYNDWLTKQATVGIGVSPHSWTPPSPKEWPILPTIGTCSRPCPPTQSPLHPASHHLEQSAAWSIASTVPSRSMHRHH